MSTTLKYHHGDSDIVILPDLKQMLIMNHDAIVTKCLLCHQTKDVFMLRDNTSVGFMRLCHCDDKPAPAPQLAISSDFIPFSMFRPDDEVAQ